LSNCASKAHALPNIPSRTKQRILDESIHSPLVVGDFAICVVVVVVAAVCVVITVATIVDGIVQNPRLAEGTASLPVLKPRQNAVQVKGVAAAGEQPKGFPLFKVLDADRTGRTRSVGEVSDASLGSHG
jgi:hypothetical protein